MQKDNIEAKILGYPLTAIRFPLKILKEKKGCRVQSG
jgi:hypothetical protein